MITRIYRMSSEENRSREAIHSHSYTMKNFWTANVNQVNIMGECLDFPLLWQNAMTKAKARKHLVSLWIQRSRVHTKLWLWEWLRATSWSTNRKQRGWINWEWCELLKCKLLPSDTSPPTSSSLPIIPKHPPIWDQVVKQMSLWRSFSLKPPHFPGFDRYLDKS